uniref:DUF4123 domain-containing protein n=1 Tax=Cupriavidus taiwanensis TaxID=164546 RepID=UPI0018DC5191|nr:DUF4123 domain-containing protein [Cupriavidus taiwanensis]
MDFAVDVLKPEAAAAQIAQWQSTQDGLAQWLLIDAMLVDFARIRAIARMNGWPIHNVLASSRLSAFGDMAPHLIELPRSDANLQARVGQLIAAGAAAPAFSWLSSSKRAEEVCQTLSYLAMAQVDGDMELYCRFADTRILPELWRTLTDSQRLRVMQNIASWSCLDRENAPRRLSPDVANSNEVADQHEFIHLTSGQFATMLDASEGDTMFSLLLDTTPELAPVEHRGKFHATLMGYIDRAAKLGIKAPVDKLQFIVLSLTCTETFSRLPELADTWRRVAGGESLKECMTQWSDAIWNVLEGKSSR